MLERIKYKIALLKTDVFILTGDIACELEEILPWRNTMYNFIDGAKLNAVIADKHSQLAKIKADLKLVREELKMLETLKGEYDETPSDENETEQKTVHKNRTKSAS